MLYFCFYQYNVFSVQINTTHKTLILITTKHLHLKIYNSLMIKQNQTKTHWNTKDRQYIVCLYRVQELIKQMQVVRVRERKRRKVGWTYHMYYCQRSRVTLMKVRQQLWQCMVIVIYIKYIILLSDFTYSQSLQDISVY